MRREAEHRKCLHRLLDFSLNLKLLQKKKIFFFKKERMNKRNQEMNKRTLKMKERKKNRTLSYERCPW